MRKQGHGLLSIAQTLTLNVNLLSKNQPTAIPYACGDLQPMSTHLLWNCSRKFIKKGTLLELYNVSTKNHSYLFFLCRHIWDPDVAEFKILQKLNMSTEIVSYRVVSMAPEPPREFVELRTWLKRPCSAPVRGQVNSQEGAEECLIVATSIDHPGLSSSNSESCSRPRMLSASNHSIRGIDLITAFVIRPAGSGRSQVHMIARIDYRGRSTSWYNLEGNFSAFCVASVRRLRESFRRMIQGQQQSQTPETVV